MWNLRPWNLSLLSRQRPTCYACLRCTARLVPVERARNLAGVSRAIACGKHGEGRGWNLHTGRQKLDDSRRTSSHRRPVLASTRNVWKGRSQRRHCYVGAAAAGSNQEGVVHSGKCGSSVGQ